MLVLHAHIQTQLASTAAPAGHCHWQEVLELGGGWMVVDHALWVCGEKQYVYIYKS